MVPANPDDPAEAQSHAFASPSLGFCALGAEPRGSPPDELRGSDAGDELTTEEMRAQSVSKWSDPPDAGLVKHR